MNLKNLLCFVALFLVTGKGVVYAQRITVTIAGTGTAGYTGDGGLGRQAKLNRPYDVCVDAAHNIYFVDQGNSVIRKISAKTGIITIVAGGGSFATDGVPATNAALSALSYVCIDATGNLYISVNNKIRKVNVVTGTITTVAGNGLTGFSGDGGMATAAKFSRIYGICVDAVNNIYVADQSNNRIRKVAGSTGIVTTIAGTGGGGYAGDGYPATAAFLSHPVDITVDNSGNVFFIDQGPGSSMALNSRIRKITSATGIITTICGPVSTTDTLVFGGPALSTLVGDGTGLNISDNGNLIFNEVSCSCRELDMASDTVKPVGGDFTVESFRDNVKSAFAYMNTPYGLCSDGAKIIYVADFGNNRIRKIILLSQVPRFAFGEEQFINPCPSTAFPINTQMSVTDIDSAQVETWTILNAPVNGALAGFPYTRLSRGKDSLIIPSGLSYIPVTSYTGPDSFRVRVSDGTFSDTVIVRVFVNIPDPGVISGPPAVCAGIGATITLLESVTGGEWSMINAHASIGPSGIVNGLTPGIDTAVYTVTGGCIATTRAAVIVEHSPSAGIINGNDSVCVGAMITLTDTVAGGIWSQVVSGGAVTIGSATGVVTGITAGGSFVFYSVTNSCGTVAASKTLTVDDLPDAGAITGPSNVCIGATMVCTDAIFGGAWSTTFGNVIISASGMVTGVASGMDTIKYAVSNTCGYATTTKVITIDSMPDAGAITGAHNVCKGATITLTDIAPGGVWSVSNGNAMVSAIGAVTGILPGMDTIRYSVTNSCGTATATVPIEVKDCTTNILAIYGQSVKIYPNPASSVLNIEWIEIPGKNANVTITDVTGRVVLTTQVNTNISNNGVAEINVSGLTDGVYIVMISSESVHYVKKIVVSKE